jgi:DNA-directed RNA polymerase subunit RPC12/RpoP
MAIEFDCPHCGHHYRLKDDLAGKAAQCKNCRKKITVPQAVTVPDDPPPVDVEAAALAAWADAPQAEEDPSKKLIPVECSYCGHKWTEPLTRAGKNTLCPNPECKQRVKIPEPKDETYDWRQTRTKGPSLAKENQQKLEGVQDAADVKQLSPETVRETILEDDVEPRPLKQKVLFAVLAVSLLAGLVFGVMYGLSSRKEGKEDRLMEEAQKEFADFAASAEALPKDEVPLFTAAMHLAGAEHALRHDSKEKLKLSMDHYAKAQVALRQAPYTPARNAAVAELAVAILALGGTEEQAREQVRIRWTPDYGVKTRPNEQLFTVHQELEKVLRLVTTADADFRAYLARRLTRELVKRDQTAIATDLIPAMLFSQAEQPEGRALVALELYRLNPASQHARREADALAGTKGASSPSVQTLFLVLKPTNAPGVPALSKSGTLSESSRLAHTGALLLEKKWADALAVAQRPSTRPEEQLRALALCADWSDDPGPALDAALPIVINATGPKARKEVNLPPFAILRLAQIAAATGKAEQARQFADGMPDDGAKAWARGDVARMRLAAAPKEKGEETWLELPDDPKKYRAGHAWGLVWIARQNARISGDRGEEAKRVGAWPAPFSAFGKVGVALGVQDREK